MKLNEYQELAMRTSPEDHDRVLNGCMGLIGESGEIMDILKKFRFQSLPGMELPKNEIIKECGDVMWYIAETATGLNVKLEDIIDVELTGVYYSGGNAFEDETATICELACMVYTFCIRHRTAECAIPILSDIYRHVTNICQMCGITIHEAEMRNIEKLKKRYPEGFDAERSVNRDKYEQSFA